jgi:RNA polymerase sigma factor (sigma-70 family)
MAGSPMSEVVQHLRRAALLQDGAGLTDGQLLERFVSRREAAAVGVLVRRHGPMVWGVCRRVLRNVADAEDAFQATFLVLIRRAASVVPREAVANWLYGVAYRTALKARATAAKRRARERQVAVMPEPEATEQGLWGDLQPLLDEELSRLPDKYRLAIVLCDLEGKTRKEAARQLGLPDGTVASRLMRGRALLAKRLARHGLAVSGGALAAVLAQNVASAGVPASVVSATIEAATLLAAGQVAGAVSVKVAALTEGVLKTMLLDKLKGMVTVGLFVAVLGAGLSAGLLAEQVRVGRGGPAQPVLRSEADQPAPAPAAAPREQPSFTLEETVSRMRWSRDGKVMVSLSVRDQKNDGGQVSLYTFRIWDGQTGKLKHSLGEVEYPGFNTFDVSPDGKLLAISQRGRIEAGDKIQIWDVEKAALLQTIEMDYERCRVWFAFSPDGGTVAVCGCDVSEGKLRGTVRLFDTKTGKLEQKVVRRDVSEVIAVAFSPDGKQLAAGGYLGEVEVWDLASGKASMTGTAPQSVAALAFSADGKQLISTGSPSGVLLWDVATGKSRELKGESGGHNLAFSPDGRFVAAGGRVQRQDHEEWAVRVWDARTGELLHEWPGWRGFAFTPDSKRLTMLVDQKTIKVMEIGTGEAPQ